MLTDDAANMCVILQSQQHLSLCMCVHIFAFVCVLVFKCFFPYAAKNNGVPYFGRAKISSVIFVVGFYLIFFHILWFLEKILWQASTRNIYFRI